MWIKESLVELRKLEGPHEQKKRDTIIELVRVGLIGASEESVWKMKHTCSRKTYHRTWKKDEVFASVLSAVRKKAQDWMANKGLYALEKANEKLALASVKAVKRLVQIMGDKDDATNSRLSAVAILDRAGMETAPKRETSMPGLEELLEKVWNDDPNNE